MEVMLFFLFCREEDFYRHSAAAIERRYGYVTLAERDVIFVRFARFNRIPL